MSVDIALKKILRVPLDFMIHKRNQFILFFRKSVKEQHQLTSVTASNRYPELFSEVSSAIRHLPSPTILSFGCSTGEECFTMQSYFPDAKIIGVDINRSNLRKAQRKNKLGNIKFLFSTREAIIEHGMYDMIFCLSVLCRWEETMDLDNCADIYSFAKFSETATMLASQVKRGGLLVIYNSNFRFEDTNAFRDFNILSTPTVKDSGFVHKYDAHNNRVTTVHEHCVYQKR